jgi:hypothetical protein
MVISSLPSSSRSRKPRKGTWGSSGLLMVMWGGGGVGGEMVVVVVVVVEGGRRGWGRRAICRTCVLPVCVYMWGSMRRAVPYVWLDEGDVIFLYIYFGGQTRSQQPASQTNASGQRQRGTDAAGTFIF